MDIPVGGKRQGRSMSELICDMPPGGMLILHVPGKLTSAQREHMRDQWNSSR